MSLGLVARNAGGPRRSSGADSYAGRLLFSTVHEDPTFEVEHLPPAGPGRIVIVGSGGCTALSLLSSTQCEIIAVDSNVCQNHLTELKAQAVVHFKEDAPRFLGARYTSATQRLKMWRDLAPLVSPDVHAYWEARRATVARGVLSVGATERIYSLLQALVRTFVAPRAMLEALLYAESVEEQQRLFAQGWNSRAWERVCQVVLNPHALGLLIDSRVVSKSDVADISAHFCRRVEYGLRFMPTRTNYFLHHGLLGHYPVSGADALPLYMQPGRIQAEDVANRLSIYDGTMTNCLTEHAPNSVRGFGLSNICEWMPEAARDALFEQIVRTAEPGARVIFRDFVALTRIPPRWAKHLVVEQCIEGANLMVSERSCQQRRVVVCRVDR